MAAIKINTGEAYHEDRLAESPRNKWTAIIAERRYYLKTNIDYDCRCLIQYVAEAEEFFAELGYESAEAMVLEAYDIQPGQAWAAVSYLKGRKAAGLPDVPLALADLGSHGGDRRSAQVRKDQADIISLKHGTQSAYLQARLRRDAPEVADALERGEFKSARAAAIEAGIIKPVPTVRLVADMAAVAGKLCQHLTLEQRIELIDLLAPDL